MVGLGTQDSYQEARDFVARHQVTFPMYWDSGFTSWLAFEIARQPASVLVSRDGTELRKWTSELSSEDHAEVLRLAAEKG